MSSSPTRVLIVADESPICDLAGDLSLDCISVCEAQEANKRLAQEHFDVLVIDLSRPDARRTDLLAQVRKRSPDCRIVLVSSDSIHREMARAFALGATDYLQKPFAAEDLAGMISRAVAAGPSPRGPTRLWNGSRLELHSQRKEASLEGIQALVSAVEAKDPYTRQHSRQVEHYATRLAGRLNLQADVVESISVASLMHDVGKIGVPDHILTKPGNLSEEELASVRRHPALGEEIIRNLSVFDTEAKIIRHHHENWDGSGYPDGLAGEEIPLPSRIIRTADAMDAMLMSRSYKGPYPVETMLDEFTRCAGRDFDPKVARIATEWSRMHTQELVLGFPVAKPARSRTA
ncbi:MAG: HD domain-containing protein [Phycisphaerae bacterium]|nr:HD domain-containing protein [Phycisphaerae bacterium]